MSDWKATVVALEIIKPGMLSLLQDAGRSGYQAYGLPGGGALDRQAAAAANYLVDQSPDHPVLEITLLGPDIIFRGAIQIALTGADLSPMLNGQPVTMYQTLSIMPGDRLTFGARREGCRTYMSVRGDWQIPAWLSSKSALRIGGQTWPEGSVLEKEKPVRIQISKPLAEKRIIKRPFYPSQVSVRLMPGPEFDGFSSHLIHHLTSYAFTLSSDCNRMGCRLVEPLPGYERKEELISSGIVPGTLQVLPTGQLILLLADAQTTGGYPRIANVEARDLDVIAQLGPGDKIRFVL